MMSNETTASVCSRKINNRNMTVNDKKPGTSLKLCSAPISAPSNAAYSIAKLLMRADQTPNENGIAAAIM